MKKFTADLKPACDIHTLENCSEDQKKSVESLKATPVDELEAQVQEEASARKTAETEFENAVKKLQAEYQQLTTQKEQTLADIKSKYNVGMIKAILNSKQDSKSEL